MSEDNARPGPQPTTTHHGGKTGADSTGGKDRPVTKPVNQGSGGKKK